MRLIPPVLLHRLATPLDSDMQDSSHHRTHRIKLREVIRRASLEQYGTQMWAKDGKVVARQGCQKLVGPGMLDRPDSERDTVSASFLP
jgi:hypothetical protein